MKTRGGRTQRILSACRKLPGSSAGIANGRNFQSDGNSKKTPNKEEENHSYFSSKSKHIENKENECTTINISHPEDVLVPSVVHHECNESIQKVDARNTEDMEEQCPTLTNASELLPVSSIHFDAHSNNLQSSIPESSGNIEEDAQIIMELEISGISESFIEGIMNDVTISSSNTQVSVEKFNLNTSRESANKSIPICHDNQNNLDNGEKLNEKSIGSENEEKITIEIEKPYAIEKVKTRKRNRNSGKEYVTAKGVVKKARTLKPLRPDCRNKCANILDEEIRQAIYQEYWSLGNYNKRVAFVASLVNIHETKITRKKIIGKATKNRTYSYVYNVEIKGCKHVVCKTCFMNTLGETEKFLSVAISKKLLSTSGITECDKRGKHTPKHKTPQYKIDQINEHISSFPAYESHYSRRHTNKKYLAPSLNLNLMYTLYCEKYPDKPVSIKIYSQEFHKTGLKFKRPKNDTCTKCDTLQAQKRIASTDDEIQKLDTELLRHQESADLAYRCKEQDKQKSLIDTSHITYTFDLQQVLPTPYLSTNKMFYLRQLSTFNLTVHNCISGESSHFMWPESTAGRGGNEVASCLFRFIESIPGDIKVANFYSDTCGGQNKNFLVVSMFQLAINLHPTLEEINHKFLVPGHTHMECDVDHSVIERAKKKSQIEIQVPRDWYQLVRTASKKNKFNVFVMEREHIFAFSEMVGKGPFQKKAFKMRNVSWLQYRKNNEKVQYKFSLSEEEEFKEISFFRKGNKFHNIRKYKLNYLYNEPRPINPKKKANLLEIAILLDKDVQEFYRNLAVEKTVAKDIDPDIDRYFSDDEDEV